MLNKAIWVVLLACQPGATWATQISGSSVGSSVRLESHGTGQVTSWQNSAASQLFSSEAGRPAVFVPGVASISSSAALAPVPLSPEGWQLVLACLGMAGFALFTILRRIRHGSRLEDLSRR